MRLIPIVVNEVEPESVNPTLDVLSRIFLNEGDWFQTAVHSLINAI